MFNLRLHIQIQSSSLSRNLDQNTVLWTFIPPFSHLQWITQIFSSNLPSQHLIQYSNHQLHQAFPEKSHGNHMPFLSANQVPLLQIIISLYSPTNAIQQSHTQFCSRKFVATSPYSLLRPPLGHTHFPLQPSLP